MAKMKVMKLTEPKYPLYTEKGGVKEVVATANSQEHAERLAFCVNLAEELPVKVMALFENHRPNMDSHGELQEKVEALISPPPPLTVGDLEPGGGVEVTLMGSAEYIYTRPILSDLIQAVIPDDKVVLLRQNDGEMTLWSANRLCELVKK